VVVSQPYFMSEANIRWQDLVAYVPGGNSIRTLNRPVVAVFESSVTAELSLSRSTEEISVKIPNHASVD
jgi:hypothetical protein